MKLPFALAKRFVAGESFAQAVPEVKALNEKNIRVTLDLVGENVNDFETAEEMTDSYICLLQSIESAELDSTISVKLTMMGLALDETTCKRNLFRLLEEAKKQNQFVRIDMEGSRYTQAAINMFREAFAHYEKHTGIVIQAYLHRSGKDIQELSKLGADVRLCKGAYKEPADIALQDMQDIREAFKRYAEILLERTSCPAIATHDDELLDWLFQHTEEHQIDKDKYEIQMLYGLREETMTELAAKGIQTRVYVPFGTMWFPYFKRRLMERKENIWFVLSTLLKR